MNSFVNLSSIFFKMEIRNKQAVVMSTVFPILMMALMGTAGKDTARDGMSYMTYIFPGILGMAYGAIGLIALPVMIASYRERGIFKKIKVTPISASKIMVSIFSTQLFIMAIQTVIILVISVFVFNVQLNFNSIYTLLLIPLLLIGGLSLLGIGLIIGIYANNTKNATTMGNLSNLVFIFLGGTFFPSDVWPKFLMPFVYINPLNYIIEAIRKTLIFETQNFYTYLTELSVITAIAVITLVFCVKVFKYE
ncbi:ABC transporter permease [Lysinibacillus sp. NPDC093692]|uniref:ABC transporter permease n=1 Tax=Lysinibacillus sp. NPDC093692 TaxID=3390578 RepID=UPI003CFE1268